MIGIVSNRSKEKIDIPLNIIKNWYEDHGKTVHCDDEIDFCHKYDFIIVLGGDGTILSTARVLERKDTPLLGINLGTLGFLTSLEKDNYIDYLPLDLNDEFIEIEERMTLDLKVTRANGIIWNDTALNDIVISRSSLSRILKFDTFVSGNKIGEFVADGYIISTPTGSTAYSLSAGGPVLSPNIKAVVLTPICAHTLNGRPMVVSDEEIIEVKVHEDYFDNIITVDGQRRLMFSCFDKIEIFRSKTKIKLIRFKNRNFYKIFEEKLGSK